MNSERNIKYTELLTQHMKHTNSHKTALIKSERTGTKSIKYIGIS